MRRFWGALAGMAVLVHAVPSLADTSVGGRISADTTWTLSGSPYLVTSSIQIYGSATSPVTLAIEPGVTVKFNPNTYIQIGDSASQGALVAQGTATDRITFTRSGSTGNWGSITFNDPTVDATTILENVDIQYSSGVTINSSSPTIRNSSITNVSGNGLYLTSANPVIDTVTITSTGSYGIYLSSSSPTITGCSVTNSYTGGYGLYLSSSNPTINNVTITNNGSYGIYLSSSSPTITGGSLTNASTTGHGIYGSGSPVISNYTVSSANSAGIYGLYLSNATSALSVTNSTISNGLYLGSTGIIPTVTGNTFTNLDNSPVHAGANIIGQLLDNNTFTGMSSAGKIEVTGEDIRQDARWKKWAAPYNLLSGISIYKDATTPATLTIDPGVTIKVASGTINVGYSTSKGALVARGTATDRIVFTRSVATGNWGTVTFNDGTVDATTVLEYLDMPYSAGVTITSASPTFRNCTMTDMAGYVSLSSANPVLENVTIANNGSYGVYLSSSSPTITGGSLTNTNATGHGIYGSGSPVIANYSVSIVNSVGKYGLYLSSPATSLSVTNSTIANGLYLGTTGILPTITGNTFTNCDNAPLHAGANIVAQLLDTNTFTGLTSAGKVEVVGEQIKQDAQWTKLVAPYWVVSGTVSVYRDATTPATLTIDPGTTVKFASGTSLQIGYGTSKGALVARGTATDRIVFTRSATTGNWGTVTFNDGTVDATTALEYLDMPYSTGVTITSASPAFRNCTMTDMAGYVSLSSANPVLENVTITNTSSYALYLSSSSPTLTNVNISTSSSSYGIYLNSSSPTVTGGSFTNSYAGGYGIYVGNGSPIISNYNVSIVNSAGKYGLYVSSTTSAFSVTNSTISNGLYLGSTGITPTVTGNTFTNLDNSPVHGGANIIGQLLDNNTFTGMSSAGKIEVTGEDIRQDARWKKWAAPYNLLSGISIYKDATTPATLTIDPGVTIKVANGTINVGYNSSKGALVARGTATDRIVITRSSTTGNWGSLTFNDPTVDASTVFEYADILYSTGVSITSASPTFRNCTMTDMVGYVSLSSANPVLENVTIANSSSYGIYINSSSPTITGGSLVNSYTGGYGIYVGSGSPVIANYSLSIVNSAGKYGLYVSSTTSAFSVTNSTIGNGLYLGSTGITPTVTGNTFTNGDNAPPHAGANIVAQLLDANTFTGLTSAGKVEVVGEQINRDTLWRKLAAPYWVLSGNVSVYKDTTTAATLTIEPGTTIKFASSYGLQIGNGTSKGALVAQGTATDRIVFTRSAATGNWGSLTFSDGTIDATTIIEYADLQYSSGVAVTSASPVFRNSSMTDMNGYLYLNYANSTLDNVIITSISPSYGIYLGSSSPVITGGSLTVTGSGANGIYGSGSPVISNYNVSIVNSAGKYGLYLSTTTSTLSVTNSTIGNGLYINSTAISPTITGNTFTNLDNSPLHAGANIISQLLDNNTFTGMSSAGKIEVTGEDIRQDARWKKWAAPYNLLSGISIYKDATTPATLTIDPGVTIRVASGTINIGYSSSKGALVAQGTSADRITFTRSGSTGNWGGITFNDPTVDATTILENADIQYSSGVTIYSSSPTIRNSTITNVSDYGLYLSYANPLIDTVTITNNGTYGMYLASSSPTITGGSITNSYTGGYGMYLSSSNPAINNVTVINNGTYGIYLSSSSPTITGGSLTNTNTTGHGIYGSGSPVISNYTVSSANSAGIYGLYLSSATSALSVTNSTISNGLYLGSTGITPTITGNTFTNLDNSPLHAGASIIGQVIANNTLTGLTSAGRVEVVGEQIIQSATWSPLVAPYLVVSGSIYVYKDAGTAPTLTIAPGTVVKFASGTGLQVGSGSYGGGLIADGSSSPILFTSNKPTPAPGDWAGITLNGSGASASILTGVTIEYGGSGGYYNTANLNLNSSSPVIRNCTIRNSAGSGIYMSSAANIPQLLNSRISGNKWGVYATSSNPYIGNSQIYGNTTAGVWNATTTIDVDARGNWWGAASGPYHAGNPAGTGNAVSDKVIFNPWIAQTPTSGLSFSDVKVAPAAFNPEGDYLTFTATLSAMVNWTITITDSTSNVIRTFTGSGSVIGQKWYGDDSQSIKVADGTYTYRIDAVNPATSEAAAPLQGSVKVARQFPIAILDTPPDNQVLSGGTVVNVTGTAADASDFKNYTLDYGAGDNPTSWTTLKSATTQVQNALIYAWDLTTATGGVYTVRLTVTDNAGNPTVKTARIRLLWIQVATVSENYISPNGDGIIDATVVSATASYPVNWTATVSNGAGAVVRTFTGTGSSFSQTWDGKDSNGIVAPDGAYTYQINALDSVSSVQAVPKTGTIVVDTTAPSATITAPASGAELRNAVSIVGTATDTNFGSYKVEYGPAAGAGPWTQLTTSTSPVAANALATWITNDLTNTVLLQNGAYLLTLTVTDKAGNVSTATLPVTMDNMILSALSASQHTLNTNAGESSSISFTINKPGAVTLGIVPDKLGPNGTPVYQTSVDCPAAGVYSITWNGTDSTGKVVPDEAYLYILNASDGTRTDGYTPAVPTGSGSVTCSQAASYYPYKNIPLVINYTVAQPERVDMNISWGGQNFKIMDSVPHLAGSYTATWDGRNPTGTVLQYGGAATCAVNALLRENEIITSGDTPKITLVKADPYQVLLSYNQFTRIEYTLSRQADVTVKLIAPSGAATTITNSQSQAAGAHGIDWTAADSSDSAGKKLIFSEEGYYTLWIQAVNPVTGASSVAKGSVQVRQ